MNVQDFSKRWALHYINPDFMKIPMSSSTVFQGSGFYLNFTLKNSPHPEAKWCVVDFYIRNTETDEYIYFNPIEDNEVFVNGKPNLDKLPKTVKEKLDIKTLFGYKAAGCISQALADKYYHGDFDILPSMTTILHNVYIELPPGQYEYTEFTCHGGYVNRNKILLISDTKKSKVIVTIPHKPIYQVYQLDTGWKEFSTSIDCVDTSFEKYEDDPAATFITSETVQDGILNEDYHLEQTSYLTACEGVIKTKKILEKKYNFQTKELDESFLDFNYELNPDIKDKIDIRSEYKTLDDFSPYELSIYNWKYSGEDEIDTSYSNGCFGGCQWRETEQSWNVLSGFATTATGETSLNIPQDKKVVLEDTLYKVTRSNKRLSYPVNFPLSRTNNFITDSLATGFRFAFTSYQYYTSSSTGVSIQSSGNTTNILYRQEGSDDNYTYYYRDLPSYIDKNTIPPTSNVSSNCFQNITYYSQGSAFDIEDNNSVVTLDYKTCEFYINCATPAFPKSVYVKTVEKKDNNLDTINYNFNPDILADSYNYHYPPGKDLLSSFDRLDPYIMENSDVYMEPATRPLISTSTPYLHIKHSIVNSATSAKIDTTVRNWENVDLDKIWVSEEEEYGQAFRKYEHYVITEDGHTELKNDWGYDSRGYYDLSRHEYETINFYFEVSIESNYNEHWEAEREQNYRQIDNFNYLITDKQTPTHRDKGIATYKGRRWSGAVGTLLPSWGWSGFTRIHSLLGINLTRDANVAQTFNLYTGYISEHYSEFKYDYLEGEYYWNCLTLLGMINSIYKYYQQQDFLKDTTQKYECIHYETSTSYFFCTCCANELTTRNSSSEASISYNSFLTIPWILTPDYYEGHDLSKTKDFKGFLFFGEKLKNRPKIKARQI